ncbi:MAG TPA: hypothetical protein VFJ06_06180 [Halococcus sp.]|nr:hypothetical protein [Halococcus sp.]
MSLTANPYRLYWALAEDGEDVNAIVLGFQTIFSAFFRSTFAEQ